MFLAVVASFAAALCTHKKVLAMAKALNIVDAPNDRKLQTSPVPMLGGIVVFLGVMVGLIVFSCMSGDVAVMLPFVFAASLMLMTGLIDDLTGLSAAVRLLFEALTVAALVYSSGLCIDSLWGLFDVGRLPWSVGFPLTIFAGVGIINAYNMVDGINGLSSGLCIMLSIVMGGFFAVHHDLAYATLAFCYAAALAPFFLFNVFGQRSRMFIGDAGTMMMGVYVLWLVVRVLSSQGLFAAADPGQGLVMPEGRVLCLPAMLTAVASVPIADTLRVMGGRICHGRSPFRADRTHLHHQFLAVGFSHLFTALAEISINLLVIALWYASYAAGCSTDVQMIVTFSAGVVFIWCTYFWLLHHEQADTQTLARIHALARLTHMGHTPWCQALQRFLDRGVSDAATMRYKDKFRN